MRMRLLKAKSGGVLVSGGYVIHLMLPRALTAVDTARIYYSEPISYKCKGVLKV